MFARTSDHCPNFCDVFVNVMFGVTVELITAWKEKRIKMIFTGAVVQLTTSNVRGIGFESS